VTGFPSFTSRTATLDGVTIHYLCGGTGSPVLLVHGLGSSAGVEFFYNLEALAARHQVIAVDLPGFGQSDKPPLAYTIDLFVRVLRDFMASIGLSRAAVIGVSMGGRVALGLALGGRLGTALSGGPGGATAAAPLLGSQHLDRFGLHLGGGRGRRLVGRRGSGASRSIDFHSS